MQATVEVFEKPDLKARIDDQEMAPFDQHNLPRDVHCAEKRPLTDESNTEREKAIRDNALNRSDYIPSRHFGGVHGFSLVALAATVLHDDRGGKAAAKLFEGFPNQIAGMSGVISNGVFHDARTKNIRLYMHSAEVVEGDPVNINPNIDVPLGCGLAALAGLLIGNAKEKVVERLAYKIASYLNENDRDDVNQSLDAYSAVFDIVGGANASVGRSQLASVLDNPKLVTPVAMVKGQTASQEVAAVVHDLAGFKAMPNGHDYFTSTPLPGLFLPVAFEHFEEVDARAFAVSSLVLGASAQYTLGVSRGIVIPENYAVAA